MSPKQEPLVPGGLRNPSRGKRSRGTQEEVNPCVHFWDTPELRTLCPMMLPAHEVPGAKLAHITAVGQPPPPKPIATGPARTPQPSPNCVEHPTRLVQRIENATKFL